MRKLFIPCLLLSLLIAAISASACTIFIANDGKHVWVGNNEDEVPSTAYRLWYFPAAKNASGYMLWSELSDNKMLNPLMYKNPQGGMNTSGLFMDYTAIDDIPVKRDPNKKDREEQVVTDVLKHCKTVSEALKYISQFNLVRLSGAQLFIADASGDYATVHGNYIVPRTTKSFALTNYCVNNNHYEPCWRRDAANEYLGTEKSYNLASITTILQRTTQKPPSNLVSNYSMAADLKNSTLHLFYKNDFTTPAVLSLKEELKKGKHNSDMSACFPSSITDVLLKSYANGGVNAVLKSYTDLRKKSPSRYNFKNQDAIRLAAQAIAGGNVKDAIKFLECLKRFDPQRTELDTWLGIAYQRDGQAEKSRRSFARVLQADPGDYLAILFGMQQKQKVFFKMNDFEGAEKVSLIGDFSNWAPLKMEKQNNRWVCEVVIPKGEHRYKFLVNEVYLADQINLMYSGSGPDIFSTLYVW